MVRDLRTWGVGIERAVFIVGLDPQRPIAGGLTTKEICTRRSPIRRNFTQGVLALCVHVLAPEGHVSQEEKTYLLVLVMATLTSAISSDGLCILLPLRRQHPRA